MWPGCSAGLKRTWTRRAQWARRVPAALAPSRPHPALVPCSRLCTRLPCSRGRMIAHSPALPRPAPQPLVVEEFGKNVTSQDPAVVQRERNPTFRWHASGAGWLPGAPGAAADHSGGSQAGCHQLACSAQRCSQVHGSPLHFLLRLLCSTVMDALRKSLASGDVLRGAKVRRRLRPCAQQRQAALLDSC